jgi:hypothetical protein
VAARQAMLLRTMFPTVIAGKDRAFSPWLS